ncbi:hypothetical protein JZ751_014748 [Albula glossodonta]|uniref:Ion transport domain-containing protein n=1 Tax=Albula glossodonta TaxID=121402 RepID=A0A8T2MZM2_9TELE|nr:hypothetical protein JZ751_014748 [Albula glossodonta]
MKEMSPSTDKIGQKKPLETVTKAQPVLYWCSRNMSFWSNISFNLAVLMNLLVAFFYPLEGVRGGTLEPHLSALLWLGMLVSLAIVIALPQPHGIRALIASTILRLIFSVGLEPTLFLLGAFNVCNKIIFLMSFVGNRGTFTRGYKAMILDMEFLYHLLYLIICSLGVFVHVFFYSLLLFDLVYREETLLNVIKSVTRNGRSIVLTAVLALILVYLFSIVGYIFFKDDFILEVDRIPNSTLESGSSMVSEFLPAGVCRTDTGENCSMETVLEALNADISDDVDEDKERTCDSLLMCIVTVLSHGLRSGGGVGDVLRKPSKEVAPDRWSRGGWLGPSVGRQWQDLGLSPEKVVSAERKAQQCQLAWGGVALSSCDLAALSADL